MEDSAIRNIEKEILRECANLKIPIHGNFLNYYVKLLVLDPKWGISTNIMWNRDDVQNFIKFITKELKTRQNSVEMITLKMQFYFRCNHYNHKALIKKNNQEKMFRLEGLLHEIMEIKTVPDKFQIDVAYKKMITYITIAQGLGNPAKEGIFKETKAVLLSIMNTSELEEFLRQPKYIKEDQIVEFTHLVTGIRLFNRDCHKGGEGMEDLVHLIRESLDIITAKMHNTLYNVMNRVNLITTALYFTIGIHTTCRGTYEVQYYLTEGVTEENFHNLKNCLILYRQQEIFLRELVSCVRGIETNYQELVRLFNATLKELHEVVKHRIAIPVEQVFPHFLQLSKIWIQLQDHGIHLAMIYQIKKNLTDYVQQANFNPHIAEMLIPPGYKTMSDAERLQLNSHVKFHIKSINPALFRAMPRGPHYKLAYLGFCPWILVETKGALVPGNPNLVGRTMHMNFAFSSAEAATAFAQAPIKYVMDCIKLARNRPELINLLKIHEQVALVQDFKELVREMPVLAPTHNVDIQTDTHLESEMNKNYKWNVWDLKREGTLLANLIHCKTSSSQTTKSYHRLGNFTQTYFHKEKEVQTKKDNYTNTPKCANFIYGLRGRKDDKQVIVDLTRPVEE